MKFAWHGFQKRQYRLQWSLCKWCSWNTKKKISWKQTGKKSIMQRIYSIKSKTKNDHLPGFTSMRTKSICGLRAATATARHPPNESPTRYIGLFGDKLCSCLIVFSTVCNNPVWICIDTYQKREAFVLLIPQSLANTTCNSIIHTHNDAFFSSKNNVTIFYNQNWMVKKPYKRCLFIEYLNISRMSMPN